MFLNGAQGSYCRPTSFSSCRAEGEQEESEAAGDSSGAGDSTSAEADSSAPPAEVGAAASPEAALEQISESQLNRGDQIQLASSIKKWANTSRRSRIVRKPAAKGKKAFRARGRPAISRRGGSSQEVWHLILQDINILRKVPCLGSHVVIALVRSS